jgi:transposase
MGKTRIIVLTDEQRQALEKGYEIGKSHAFRKRCHLVLLKSEKRSSEEVSKILKMSEPSVNTWLNRYESDGIVGLQTKKGRGRKPILDVKTDTEIVKEAIKIERQRLSQTQEAISKKLQKEFSVKTLKRFLKSLSADISVSENPPKIAPILMFITIKLSLWLN